MGQKVQSITHREYPRAQQEPNYDRSRRNLQVTSGVFTRDDASLTKRQNVESLLHKLTTNPKRLVQPDLAGFETFSRGAFSYIHHTEAPDLLNSNVFLPHIGKLEHLTWLQHASKGLEPATKPNTAEKLEGEGRQWTPLQSMTAAQIVEGEQEVV